MPEDEGVVVQEAGQPGFEAIDLSFDEAWTNEVDGEVVDLSVDAPRAGDDDPEMVGLCLYVFLSSRSDKRSAADSVYC